MQNVYTHFKYLERIETEIKYIKKLLIEGNIQNYWNRVHTTVNWEKKIQINEGYRGVEG